MGFPGFSGFFSKDEILYLAYLKSPVLWAMGLAGAGLTSFYMWRLMALTFWGEPRDGHAYEHASESPWTMAVPLALLAAGSLLAGWWGVPEAFGGRFAIGSFLAPSLTYGQVHGGHAVHGGPAILLAIASTGLSLAAGLWGFLSYRDGLALAEARASKWPTLHRWVENKYYVDEGLERFLLGPIRGLGHLLWKLFDVIFIDGLGVNLPAAMTRLAGDGLAFFQTGRVRNYVLAMTLGTLALLWIFLK
jgi:NADH-quinone oxidoreductase subunit L